jgi:Concanavalin A-like lectin/glucanases superfamily
MAEIGWRRLSLDSLLASLVAYYHMDEASWDGTPGEVVDSSGSGNDGTAASVSTAEGGILGRAGDFTGLGHITVPSGFTNCFSGQTVFSVGFWVYLNDLSAIQFFFARSTTTSPALYGYVTTDGSLYFYVGYTGFHTAPAKLAAGGWHYVEFVKDGDATGRIYVDAVLAGNGNLSSTPVSDEDFYIGQSTVGTYPLNGKMDEFHVFTDIASQDDVTAIYNGGSGLDLLASGSSVSIERELIALGKPEMERDFVVTGLDTGKHFERPLLLRGLPWLDRELIFKGKSFSNTDLVMKGKKQGLLRRYLILGGKSAAEAERDFVMKGKNGFSRDMIVPSKPMREALFILRAVEYLPVAKTKRLMLLDTLNLRSTAVYRNPRDISTLKIVYGDLSGGRIPCTPLDKDGYIHHASDRPMQSIGTVYVDGEPAGYGYRAFPAWQDETGRGIACVIFDNPQYDKQVSVSGKGAAKLTTGELIENPADMIYDVMINVQGYDISSIDAAELSRFYADCLAQGIKVADILDDGSQTIKAWLDNLAMNIRAQWMISDGKSVMRLRWT